MLEGQHVPQAFRAKVIEMKGKNYEARLASEGSLHLIGKRLGKLAPRAAAFLRKLGSYVDSVDVAGVDDGLLSREDAEFLRASGVLVLDSEIAHD
jgi:hypothetical protein